MSLNDLRRVLRHLEYELQKLPVVSVDFSAALARFAQCRGQVKELEDIFRRGF